MAKEGKEKKKGSCLKTILIMLGVLVVIGVISSLAGGNDKEVKDVTESKHSNTDQQKEVTEEPKEEAEEKTEFGIGETAEQKNIQVTLLSATESQGSEFIAPDEGNIFLLLEFEIANNSDKDITISSIANFEAYCDDYSLNQDILGLQTPEAEGKNQLDGSVAAGKKMNGIIAYQVPSDHKTFEINVSPDFWSSNDIKFVLNK